MLNKITDSAAQAISNINDGATILIGGFGLAGQPAELIDALIERNAKELTIVNNNAGNGDTGLAALLKAGCVRKIICSFPRQHDSYVFDELYRAGKIELEVVPQGTLAARIQAGGSGFGAIYTPTAYGTLLAEGKETRTIDGVNYVLEYPIKGDFALIKALKGDRWGNLIYNKAARNFGPIMAAASSHTIAQVSEVVELGVLDPEHIITPGIFVKEIVRIGAKSIMTTHKPWSVDEIARRVAHDIEEGMYVNLGIGQPTKVADFLPEDKDIFLHSENGVLGMGPEPAQGEEDGDLINAGKQYITLLKGGSYFHHGDSFAMIRGGHIDLCVLGAFEVAKNGDIANWFLGRPKDIPAVGGAMDLAVGAKEVYVMMDHVSKNGDPKIVEKLNLPITGEKCVNRIYTDLSVINVTEKGLVVREMIDGLTFEELQAKTGAKLIDNTAD